MTIAELIKMLEQHPSDMRVFLDHSSGVHTRLAEAKRVEDSIVSWPDGLSPTSKYFSYCRTSGNTPPFEKVLFIL